MSTHAIDARLAYIQTDVQ